MKCMYMPDEYFVQVFSVLKALHIFPKVIESLSNENKIVNIWKIYIIFWFGKLGDKPKFFSYQEYVLMSHDDIIWSNPNYNTKATEFLRKKQVFDRNKNIWMSFYKSTIEPW